MELNLLRNHLTDRATTGLLLVDGVPECVTLEDCDRGLKTGLNLAQLKARKRGGVTAIPTGRYRVIVNRSPRFGRLLPRLQNVPAFEGILIHPGNDDGDTDGCILVGQRLRNGQIMPGTSRPAFEALFAKIQAALGRGEAVWIEIGYADEVEDLRTVKFQTPAKA